MFVWQKQLVPELQTCQNHTSSPVFLEEIHAARIRNEGCRGMHGDVLLTAGLKTSGAQHWVAKASRKAGNGTKSPFRFSVKLPGCSFACLPSLTTLPSPRGPLPGGLLAVPACGHLQSFLGCGWLLLCAMILKGGQVWRRGIKNKCS